MRFSWALWEPEHGVDDGPRDTSHKAVILHTAVTNAVTLNLPDSNRPGVGCHGYIDSTGTFHQYLDTDRHTGHAWDANSWTVGIETWDGGDPDHTPWNQAQLDTIDRILRELAVPAQALTEAPSDGVGYHRQYDSWNQSNHSCPTDTRIAQVPGIITRLAGGGTDLTPEESNELNRMWNAYAKRADQYGIPRPKTPDLDDGSDKPDAHKGWIQKVIEEEVRRENAIMAAVGAK